MRPSGYQTINGVHIFFEWDPEQTLMSYTKEQLRVNRDPWIPISNPTRIEADDFSDAQYNGDIGLNEMLKVCIHLR
jgi:hypothetical protein